MTLTTATLGFYDDIIIDVLRGRGYGGDGNGGGGFVSSLPDPILALVLRRGCRLSRLSRLSRRLSRGSSRPVNSPSGI